jgi:hypothetical protein
MKQAWCQNYWVECWYSELNGDNKIARSSPQASNSGIMSVSSSTRMRSKEYPETSYLAYNKTPRHSPKDLQYQFYITLVRADYVMWSLSIGFQRKCRYELSDPNSRTTMAISNTLVLYISKQTDSICCNKNFPATFCFSRHVTSCASAFACIISPRIKQFNF